MAMRLRSAIELQAGGPGSGCNPEVGKCGRPAGAGHDLQPGQSTEERYKNPQTGEWAPERKQLHDQVIQQWVKGHTAPEGRKPIAYVLGGGTASGKTTASRAILGDDPNVMRVDPDELKLQVPEYDQLKKEDPYRASARVHEESSYLTKKIMAAGIARGLDLTYDATTSGKGSLGVVQALLDHGYDVHVMFVDIPVETAIQRSAQRAANSSDPINFGRNVPEDTIRESHQRAAANFFVLKDTPGIKSVRLYDNSANFKPRLIFAKKQFDNGEVHDQETFKNYRRKALQEIDSSAQRPLHRYGRRRFSYA